MILPAALPLVMAQRSFQSMADLQKQSRRNEELAEHATRLLEELKAKQEELLRSSKLAVLGTFAAGIGHEFNNLLTAINGNAQLGLMSHDVREKDESLDVVVRASLRGRSITNGLLTFARRRDPKRELSSLAEIVAETVAFVQPEFARLNISIEQRLELVPLVSCDAGQIGQVLMNLLTNARDAMAHQNGGPILIELRARETFAELAVTDAGAGIPAELLPNIFQPFTTTKNDLGSSGTTGTGLGLAICQSIVESHGGAIEVQSRVDHGTTMLVRLPLATEPEPAHAEPAGDVPPLSILVIDDEPAIGDWLRRCLGRERHAVATASNPQSALQLYHRQHFDLVICDMIMPGVSGAEFVRLLRAVNADTQILVMSAQNRASQIEEMIAAGAIAVLSKPFSSEDLLAVIRSTVQMRIKAVG
jgi:signal transduction histidine kinase/CheY-like chemotaxis protein